MNVSDFIIQRLIDWKIETIFGYPGDGINGILGALNRNQNLRFIQARHEEMAAFMARPSTCRRHYWTAKRVGFGK